MAQQQIEMVQPEKRDIMIPPWAWCPKCGIHTWRNNKGECLSCKKKINQSISENS